MVFVKIRTRGKVVYANLSNITYVAVEEKPPHRITIYFTGGDSPETSLRFGEFAAQEDAERTVERMLNYDRL